MVPQLPRPVAVETLPGLPSGHVPQLLEPAAEANMPTAHDWHAKLPAEEANLPMGQDVQLARPTVENLPAGQAIHGPPLALNVPAAQGVHVAEPVVRATVPGEQFRHLPGPRKFLKEPTAQSLHLLICSCSWNLPIGHCWQPKDLDTGVNQPCSQSLQVN